MPAIIDPEGPDGQPISVFESGAILQYLGRKSGRFYGASERERVEIEQWLFWQVGGVGPMAGQAHHFLRYAPGMDPPNVLPYAQDRYRNEVARLYSVLEPPARRPRLRRRRLFHRRHGDLALGQRLAEPAAGHRPVPAHEGLARPGRERPAVQAGRAVGAGAALRHRAPTARRRRSSSARPRGR